MATKSKKTSKKKVKVGTLSKSKKNLGKGEMKKVRGGATHGYSDAPLNFGKV